MNPSLEDTIAAIATPLGEGGVGVVRISGGQAGWICRKIIDKAPQEIDPQRVYHGWIGDEGERTDEVLYYYMKAPHSYTGEDVVEINCHGGIAVLKTILGAALGCGARMAGRGEFTKRAFLNRKIDLAQAEAVLDLISAPTKESAGVAIRQLEGRLSEIVAGIREKALALLAALEAAIDFPEDAPELLPPQITAGLAGILKEIDGLLDTAEQGKIYREGLVTVIIGKPNVGKSSLLNALLGEERAIVTEIPGTTRDTIEEKLNVHGIPLRIVDTAGIRHPRDKAEELGVERTEKELASADFVLIVVDGSQELDEGDRMALLKGKGKRGVVVVNKIDLGLKLSEGELAMLSNGFKPYKLSALRGEGVRELADGIFDELRAGRGVGGESAVAINARHMDCLLRTKEALSNAMKSAQESLPVDFITIDLKEAVAALGEVSGELVSEEVINSIFEKFCVGK